jgi:type VI secretion system secreted protein Hcp
MAQVDYFLKIDGVEGESTDDKHKAEIDVVSFSWGVTNSGSAGFGSGQGSGKVVANDFSFVKLHDKSSPVLYIACATGQHYKNAVLVCRKAGGGQQEYLKITMEDVLVSSFVTSGSDGDDVVPTDSITLNYGKLEHSYKIQKADGGLGGEAKQKYDFIANKKI